MKKIIVDVRPMTNAIHRDWDGFGRNPLILKSNIKRMTDKIKDIMGEEDSAKIAEMQFRRDDREMHLILKDESFKATGSHLKAYEMADKLIKKGLSSYFRVF